MTCGWASYVGQSRAPRPKSQSRGLASVRPRARGGEQHMASARPGPPQLYPQPRNDLTVPDLYGDAVIGRGPRTLPPPAARGAGRSRPAEPGRSSARRRRQLGTTGAPRRCRWCPSRSATAGSRWARLAIIVTVSAWIAYTVNWFFADFFHPGNESAIARTEEVLYLLIVTLLTASAMAYLLARLGFFYRTRTHHRATRGQPGPVLRHQAPDADHDHPLLPGGRAGHHDHAAVGRAPGVPGQVGRTADRRPVRAQER